MPPRPPLKPVDATRPLLGCFSAYAALAGVFFLLLYWHMQPSVLPNPGMTVRFAPPGTRVEPLPRKMDAPELAAVQESAPSSEALAYDASHRTSAEKPKREARAPVRKRARAVARREYREYQEPAYGYAQQQWTGSYQPWGGGRWF